MKTVRIILALLILAVSTSCQKKGSGTITSPQGHNVNTTNLQKEPPPNFGIFSIGGHPDVIRNSGPTGSGWKGIVLPSGIWSTDLNDFQAARDAGYYPIVANLRREDVSQCLDPAHWAEIQGEIDFGKVNGAHWFYVDDALSTGGISKEEIDRVASYVHASPNPRLLATGEYAQNIMQANPNWHQNVDIIMPYKYEFTPSQLGSFFRFVRDNYPYKSLKPILGYHAEGPGGFWPNQTGTPGTGHIEVAKAYSSNGMIFYYRASTQPNLNDFWDLTYYLQDYYQMGGGL